MEQKNNNIEEFFLKSMEQFSDIPSENVWNELSVRLDSLSIPFYQNTRFWVITSISIVASILLLWSYIYAHNSIHLLSERLALLEKENEALEAALDSVHSHYRFTNHLALADEIPEAKSIKTAKIIPIAPFSLQFKHPKFNLRSYSTNHKPFNPISSFSSREDSNTTESPQRYWAKLSNQSVSTQFIQADLAQQGPRWDMNEDNKESHNKRKRRLSRKKSKSIGSALSSLSFSGARFGITAIGSHNYLQFKSELGPGYKLGIVGEVKLSENLDISASLAYNELNHVLSIGEFRSVEVNVPDYLDPGSMIPAAKWKEHISTWDLDLGFKWYLKEFLNGDKLFLHPSASIQRFRTHRFNFRAVGGGQREQETTKLNFISSNGELTPWNIFSATQLQVGIERQLNKRLSIQVGLWTHKKWRWYGGIGRNYSAQGIQTTIFYKPRKNNAYR